jgi:hypothetical protein
MNSKRLRRRDLARFGAECALAPMLAATLLDEQLAAQPGQQPARGPLVDRWLELVARHYPQRPFDAAALAEIRSDLELQLANSRALSAYPLTNADGPGFLFRAFRAD